MIHGIVASQLLGAGGVGGGGDSDGPPDYTGALAVMDFINGIYQVAEVDVAIADIIDRPDLIGVDGLSPPDPEGFSGVGQVEILGDFLAVLLAVDWTIELEWEEIWEDNSSNPLAVTNASDDLVGVTQESAAGSTVNMGAYDANGIDFRLIYVNRSFVVGMRKIAMTRTDAKIAFSSEGSATQTDTTGAPLDQSGLDSANFFWDTGDCRIRRLVVWPAQLDAALPAMSTL